MYYESFNSVSEQLFDLVLLVDNFPFKYNFVEVVVFKLIDLYVVLSLEIFVKFSTLIHVTLRESNFVQLIDVFDVIDSESFLELFRKFLYMFSVTNRKDYPGDIVILASSQLFSYATNRDNLS